MDRGRSIPELLPSCVIFLREGIPPLAILKSFHIPMSLSTPTPRTPLHLRNIECHGYRRSDGLFDIEGRVTDSKTYDFPNDFRGHIKAGENIHDMSLRLTLNQDLVIHEVEADFESHPYRICPDIAPAFHVLKGLKIGPGWIRKARSLLGKTKGCTHLVELLGPLATVAFQTIVSIRQRQEKEPTTRAGAKPGRPPQLDSCHAYASDSEVVRKHWPNFYTGE